MGLLFSEATVSGAGLLGGGLFVPLTQSDPRGQVGLGVTQGWLQTRSSAVGLGFSAISLSRRPWEEWTLHYGDPSWEPQLAPQESGLPAPSVSSWALASPLGTQGAYRASVR